MRKPVLARSDDRRILAKKHPIAGEPEEWLTTAISFNFFIDWTNLRVQKEIWVKRLLDENEIPPAANIEEYLRYFDDQFADTRGFAEGLTFDLHYILFDDGQDWSRKDSILYDLHCAQGGWICETVTLERIKERIFTLSGGATKIGPKGLTYSTSNLEAALSHTCYLWPGDVDGIILGKNRRQLNQPLAILEYKKHTRNSQYESVRTYYENGADQKKYERLQLLRDEIDPLLPLIVVTYPTLPAFDHLLLELISVDAVHHEICIAAREICDLPANPDKNLNYRKAVMQLMQRWKGIAEE